jgi:hypothetical protein
MTSSRKSKKKIQLIKKSGCGCSQAGGANNNSTNTKKNNTNIMENTVNNLAKNYKPPKNNLANTPKDSGAERTTILKGPSFNINNSNANKKNNNKLNISKMKPEDSSSLGGLAALRLPEDSSSLGGLAALRLPEDSSSLGGLAALRLPEDVNSMTNEEIEALIEDNPKIFGNLSDNLKEYKNAKNEAETAKLEQEVAQLDKKIKNSSKTMSSIMKHIEQQGKERTDGYYIIGVNIPAVLNYLFKNTSSDNTNSNNSYKKRFRKLGEYYNVNPDEIDYLKPRMIEKSKQLADSINNDTQLDNIAGLSKEYNTSGNITPTGLLKMTRLLFQTKKDEKQWLRVVELMELIFNNIGKYQDLTREEFFNQKTPIGLDLITELEEIYNTQHIFTGGKSTVDGDAYEFYSKQL